jgi:type 1 glutamine amidotransferase
MTGQGVPVCAHSGFSCSPLRVLPRSAPPRRRPVLKILFGDNGLHKPAERLRAFAPVMMNRGIQIVYTEDLSALTLANLKRYDAVLIYANIDQIATEPERALLDYVNQGGGLVAVHSASYSFRNSERLIALIGAQFQRHDPIASFRTRLVTPDHPVARGFSGFERRRAVHKGTTSRTARFSRSASRALHGRTEGKGRVFYTAWGHDERSGAIPVSRISSSAELFRRRPKLPDALAGRPKTPALERSIAPFLLSSANAPRARLVAECRSRYRSPIRCSASSRRWSSSSWPAARNQEADSGMSAAGRIAESLVIRIACVRRASRADRIVICEDRNAMDGWTSSPSSPTG